MAESKRSAAARKLLLAYSAKATQYCCDILSGKIRACKWVRLACQRHLDDLVKSRTEEFEYKFDRLKAGRACAFIERFPHVKGRWARGGSLIVLEPWQCFIVCSLFGWIKKSDGFRRFVEAVILVPRKNGKTALVAGINLKMFVADDEPGSEVYAGASDKEQAKILFNMAARMARRAPGFKEYFGITIAKESMYCVDSGSVFSIVIGNPGDGPNPHCFAHDEFHEQPTFAQYETAKTGMMSRDQPLDIVISTAGVDVESPCHALQEDLKRVLEGNFVNERLFGLVYTLDNPEDWKTLEGAKEANPNFGVSVLPDRLMADIQAAIQRPNRQGSVKTKNFNIWINAGDPWMDMEKWKKCIDPAMKIEDFLHDPCYEGFDLGARIDLTSRCKVFVRGDQDGKRHYFAFGRHYVPIDRACDGEHSHYERWLNLKPEPAMTGHQGAEIQLAFVQKEVEEEIGKFNYARLVFDPHQAMQMQQELRLRLGENEQTPDEQKKVLDIPQTWSYLSPAMKEVQAAVYSGRFHHTGDPVLAWAISCVYVQPDRNENIFPRKVENRINKIDPASALFNAFYPALAAVPQTSSNDVIFF